MSGLGVYTPGLPGFRSLKTASNRIIFRDGQITGALSGGRIISGTYSRDPDNTGNVTVLRAGLLMGKRTSGGLYAPSIMGVSDAAYAAGGTTLTVTAQFATELARRVGASGTFTIVGPPAASGVVASETVTYSAIATSTTVTITALANSYVSGSLLMPTDGSENILTVIPDCWGIPVVDTDGSTNLDVPFPVVPIAGTIIAANLINYPSDTSLRAWLQGALNRASGGKWVLDSIF